jgi:signal transduction histidine kinase/CheY-like chemotaxis protein
VNLLAELAARRFNITLLTKPVEPAQLAASIRAALLYSAGRRENRRLIAELREANRRKDEFLAMLAHELRNPVAAIEGAARVASVAEERESLGWGLDVIARQSRHLARLLEDLLDIARITRGKVDLHTERIDATGVLRQAVEAVRMLVEQRGHRFDVDLGGEAMWVDADPHRLQQMVVNLLTNAARYTPDGGRIRLGAERRGDELIIRVADDGVGIPPETLSRIFELFVQGDRSPDRTEGGLGIGLTLVKALVELHGGSVSASSGGPGRGSEFIVSLPAAAGPPLPVEPAHGTSSPARKAARVLVVDDSEDTARGLARLLRRGGHDVRLAHDGPTALTLACEQHPEYVLLDIGLPGMDGYQLASQLRREEWGRAAVLIAISGYGQTEDRRRSEAVGIDHHLVKPVDLDALVSLIG